MKCDLAQQNIALAAYGEISDDANHQLEQHLLECEECRRDMQAMRGLKTTMALYPVEEPSSAIVARARMRLEEALDNMPHGSWLVRLAQTVTRSVGRLRAAPVMASLLLLVGLGAGGYGGYVAGLKAHDAEQSKLVLNLGQPPATTEDNPAQIANVSGIIREPNSEIVKVNYNRLVPETMQGSLDDPRIRQLLLLGTQNNVNPGVSDDSVDLLANECRNGHQCDDGPIRNALMVALRYDKNANVRMKALEGLQPYIAEDMRVRDAVLESLMKDSDPRVRSQAINLIEPVESDSSVREVLHTVATQDQNAQIRTVSRQVLQQLPEIQ
ncbi:HEAT repeat domain-containing protein [Alloacidobacterium dinghuense]|uniref:HEAT repeat domain-containing protein n=1 Tax=Alloacidobacterium dinghuense TaxID=2763107 RepID=A0A7G8BGZ6_9BACT|nr:zf-HC2 domain-containing protein [Alloacidobacterium dinghuense]QNI31816.1 HEAT repeat domain-containing protein [Alloacidobacterium dinghuense]